MKNKWFKLNPKHRLFQDKYRDILGVVYSIVEFDHCLYEEWYNIRGNSWIGSKAHSRSIDFWNEFGFEECTEKEAKNMLKKLDSH